MGTRDEANISHDNGTSAGARKELNQPGKSHALHTYSVDEIMWQVRAELNRLRKGYAGASTLVDSRRLDLTLPSWKPEVPALIIKDNYHLSELLAFSDADFVDAAYRAILHRAPDEKGFNHYLQALRGGGSPKILILREFLDTPEGKATGVCIQGFFFPALLDKWRRKSFLGPIISWVHSFLRLGTIADRHATHEANDAREIREMGGLVNEVSEHLMHRLIAMKAQFAGQVGPIEFEELKNEHESTKSRVARLEAEMARISAEAPIKGAPGTLAPFGAGYEDHFRGNCSLIRARLEPYLDLLRKAGAGTTDAPIVDVGCGRGDWLELVRDCGLIGQGIEINRAFIDMCRARGLEVVEGDAIETLRGMPDGSAGAITSMHVIEYLPFERAIAFLDEARRVLRPRGLILFEAPGPENLSVGDYWFYMEPARRNPLPPEALRWIVEARGFHDVRIERLVLARDQNVPVPFPTDEAGEEALNASLATWSAYLDYAIVGKRP